MIKHELIFENERYMVFHYSRENGLTSTSTTVTSDKDEAMHLAKAHIEDGGHSCVYDLELGAQIYCE